MLCIRLLDAMKCLTLYINCYLEDVHLPDTWTSLEDADQSYYLLDVSVDSPEYKNVKISVDQTKRNTVKKIIKVTSPDIVKVTSPHVVKVTSPHIASN